ncbi:hypothetical protein U9M48_036628 [Paspalum notatum var. saurae]|uniref:Uncharacterized protein n=1 Tax=Paspalum notatum var. saurae TaxID=547442 RepID=A0AAQ3UEU7_PASNO
MAGAIGRCAVAVLDEDDRGIPRSLRLFAARVEAEACRHAAAARSAGSELVRAFRGRETPAVPIRDFLERVHLVVRRSGRSGDSATPHTVRIDGTCFVLAALYLHRFLQSPAAREAGILVEPATAHRLAAVALFLGTKFGGHAPKKWTILFELASGRAIRAAEMADLEERFLRAVSFRLFVAYREYDWFSRVLVSSAHLLRGSCATTMISKQADAAGGEEMGAQAPRRSDSTNSCKRPVDVAVLCSTSQKRQADARAREEDRRRHVRPCLPLPSVISH